ncbi:hypothetical protein IW262DRAFT_1516361 [Armillaria fumosa]|nr:hypothetical protein IW262DRAFT_1516361 [Armillaria fumosa]
MSGDSNIGVWIQFAKLTVAAGEMAPFPYIKGVAGCIATILEIIELEDKNNEDLQDLTESIGTTIQIIKETVEAHGDTSATHFRDLCLELQKYLESLIAELNTTRRRLKSKRITRFLTTKKVSAVIDGYKQRVNNIKADYLVLVTTDSRLAISDMQDALINMITQATETAQSRMTSTVNAQTDCIRGEICSLGNIQSEHAARICEKLQDMKGYYRGLIRELRMGDIYVERLVSPKRDSTQEYQDCYGTVECSSTAKIIRVYQYSTDNQEAILKQFNEAADAFMNIKHTNIAQIFGVCRSPTFLAIVFHGSTQIPFDDYERKLTAKQIIPFYIQLLYDLESVAEYLSRHPMFLLLLSTPDRDAIRLNENGKVVVTNRISDFEIIGGFIMCITDVPKDRVGSWSSTEALLPNQIDRWSSSLTSRKEDLCNAYDAIKHIVWRPQFLPFYPPDQPYALGSVLTSPGGTLVGRIPIELDEWILRWKGWDKGIIIPLFHSTHNYSITIPLPYAGTRAYNAEISLRSFDGTLDSWIAQASQLQSRIYSMSDVRYDGLSLIYPVFHLGIDPERCDFSFRLCDTFMAADCHHTLSLSISTPLVDYQTNKVSWPVFTWYDVDVEISSGEVEEIFGVKLLIDGHSRKPFMSKKLVTTTHELNADYKFDPGRGGADICECFGWPLMEVLDVSTGDWIPLHGTVSESTSVTSNNRYRTSSVKIVSLLENAPEGGHGSEASITTEIATAVQTIDQKSKHDSREFIIMFIVISVILLSFVVQTYM